MRLTYAASNLWWALKRYYTRVKEKGATPLMHAHHLLGVAALLLAVSTAAPVDGPAASAANRRRTQSAENQGELSSLTTRLQWSLLGVRRNHCRHAGVGQLGTR